MSSGKSCAPKAGMKLRLNLDYFTHQVQGPEMTWRDAGKTPVLGRLFSDYLEMRLGPARDPEKPVEQRHRDLAASMQAALEEVLLAHVSELASRTKEKNLCLAGGVAFNCVANGKMLERTRVRKNLRPACRRRRRVFRSAPHFRCSIPFSAGREAS